MQVLPAVLPKSYEELLSKLERVKDFNNLIQIDLVDGVVGEEKTWIPNPTENLSEFPSHDFQFDLMVEDWEQLVIQLSSLLRLHSVVFHIDSFSEEDVERASSLCLEKGIRAGFSITNDSACSVLTNALFAVRETNRDVFVQVMGIRTIGVQGQTFDEECLSRIRKIRESFGEIFIQVDGAMRPETARLVKDAGADAIVVGSYLFGREEMSQPLEDLSLI